jgi:hypothetical protein
MTSAVGVPEVPVTVDRDSGDPRRWRALVVTQLAAFMVLLDSKPHCEL